MSRSSDATVLRIVDLQDPLFFTRNEHLLHDDSAAKSANRVTNCRQSQQIDSQRIPLRNNADKEAAVSWEEIEPAAVRFEAINIDNHLVERHPKIALNVIELRVALAMSFLEFREINDRM